MQNRRAPAFPPQHQDKQPGKESAMNPLPVFEDPSYKSAGKLTGKKAVVTGGDSGIGRAVSVAFAKEGADVTFIYLNENSDADETKRLIESHGVKCLSIAADLGKEQAAVDAMSESAGFLGGVDILINNCAVQYPQNSILDITAQQLAHTFESNFFSYFFTTKAALPHMKSGGAIVNTTSITAFEGSETLIDYSSTKGAIVAFTRSMALSLAGLGIRVNAVSPGPVWTPLIVSSFSKEKTAMFGSDTPMKRAAQPYELAPAYVFLSGSDSSNITGQVIHVNSGIVVN